MTVVTERPQMGFSDNGSSRAPLERYAAHVDRLMQRLGVLPQPNESETAQHGPVYHFSERDDEPRLLTLNAQTTTIGSGDRAARITVNVYTRQPLSYEHLSPPSPDSLEASVSLAYATDNDTGELVDHMGVRLEVHQNDSSVTLISNMGRFDSGKYLDPVSTTNNIVNRLRQANYAGQELQTETQNDGLANLHPWTLKYRAAGH